MNVNVNLLAVRKFHNWCECRMEFVSLWCTNAYGKFSERKQTAGWMWNLVANSNLGQHFVADITATFNPDLCILQTVMVNKEDMNYLPIL